MYKRRILLITVGIVFLILFAILIWRPTQFFELLKVNKDDLQGPANLMTILSGIFSIISFFYGLKSPRKTSDNESPQPAVDVNVTIENPPQKLPKTEPGILRNSYLESLFNTCRTVSLAGIDPKAASSESEALLDLDAVYTAMLTEQAENVDEHRRDAKLEKTRRLSAIEQLNKHKHLVLLGDPGSGKSTFVNFVTLCLAGEALDKPKVNLSLLTAPLPKDEEDEENEHPQPWVHGSLMPVRVILRDFAARGLSDTGDPPGAECLWKFIENELKASGIGDFAPHLRKELLERGGLVLLDGLDEVPEAEKQREQLKQVVKSFVGTYAKCRVLVTSRVYAYERKEWHLPGFAVTRLAPFTKGQIKRFIHGWYDHIAGRRGMNLEDAKGRATLLERAVFTSDRLLSLAERPLLLTLMASLHAWRGGSLPERRVELYADATNLLLDWWEKPKVVRNAKGEVIVQQPSLAEWLRVDKEDVRHLLNRLAFKAHERQARLTGTADVPEGDLVSGLMHLRRNPEANPKLLVRYLSDRAGLLLPRGSGAYTFPHRSFQEYLAACHLTDDNFPDKLAELGRTDPDRWREVVLLGAGKSAGGTDFAVWALAESLCGENVTETQKGEAECWGALLAGQVLAESANLTRLNRNNERMLDRVRDWLVFLMGYSDFPVTERVTAGNTLARLGDPRFREDMWFLPDDDLLGFVEIPGGLFKMGSDKERDLEAMDRELPQHELRLDTYYISRYPVTVAQFRAFVEDTDYKPLDHESLRGIFNHPVAWVALHEALKYCDWLTEKLSQRDDLPPVLARLLQKEGWHLTLPSEAEWEKAARGADGRIYPWGDDPDPNRANYDDTGIGDTSPVGCFPAGESPYGCQDMAGNVWEWTRSLWGESWEKPKYGYPYNPENGRENLRAPDKVLRVLRGGSFNNSHRNVRCAVRHWNSPGSGNRNLGFRVVLRPRL